MGGESIGHGISTLVIMALYQVSHSTAYVLNGVLRAALLVYASTNKRFRVAVAR